MNRALDIWLAAMTGWIDAAHAVLCPHLHTGWRTPILTDRVRHLKPEERRSYNPDDFLKLAPGE